MAREGGAVAMGSKLATAAVAKVGALPPVGLAAPAAFASVWE